MDKYIQDKICFETGGISIPSNNNPRVVIIGGGFVGLSLIPHLKNKPVQAMKSNF